MVVEVMVMGIWHAATKYEALVPKALQVGDELKLLDTEEAREQLKVIHESELKFGPLRREAEAAYLVAAGLELRLVANEKRVESLCAAVAAVANDEEERVVLNIDELYQGDVVQLGADVLQVLQASHGPVGVVTALLSKAHDACADTRAAYDVAREKLARAEATLHGAALTFESRILAGLAVLRAAGLKRKPRRARQERKVSIEQVVTIVLPEPGTTAPGQPSLN
jgi:uncharacterized protein (DUF2267 family)